MIRRKSVIGLCLLCAFALTAVGAQSASAATKGTTVFTCKGGQLGKGQFNKAHCKPEDAVASGDWTHIAVAQDTTTEITGTSTETDDKVCIGSKMQSVQAGIPLELKAPCSHILIENPVPGTKSWVMNKKDESGEHYIEGTAWLDYTEVEVAQPAGKGCKVKGGTIIAHLKFTSTAQGDNLKFVPEEGKPFAEFTIEGCSVAALNKKYEVKGSVLVEPKGATLNTTEAGVTAQGTLTLGGQKAGLEGTMTVKSKLPADTEDTALSVTTVETP